MAEKIPKALLKQVIIKAQSQDIPPGLLLERYHPMLLKAVGRGETSLEAILEQEGNVERKVSRPTEPIVYPVHRSPLDWIPILGGVMYGNRNFMRRLDSYERINRAYHTSSAVAAVAYAAYLTYLHFFG